MLLREEPEPNPSGITVRFFSWWMLYLFLGLTLFWPVNYLRAKKLAYVPLCLPSPFYSLTFGLMFHTII